MKITPFVLLLAVVAAGEVAAAPIVIDAREAFMIRTIDGGVGTSYGVAHLPGQDKGIVSALGVGIEGNVSYFQIIQLGGPDAGAIVGQLNVKNAIPFTVPYPLFREQPVGGGQPVVYFANMSEIARLDGTDLTVLSTDTGFAIGYGQATTSGGLIRIPTLTGRFDDVGWGELSHLADGGLGGTVLAPAFGIPGSTGTPFESYSPPETGEVYALPITDLKNYSVWYGRYGEYDAGYTDLGTLPVYSVGTLPHILRSAGHTYWFSYGNDAGSFAVYDVSPSGVTPRGDFFVSVDGVVCDADLACAGYPYLIVDGFPGYPAGAFVVQGQIQTSASPRMFLMVGLDDLASALGLEFDGGTLPTGLIPKAASDPGGGGGGGVVKGYPMGPGISTHSSGSCSTVPAPGDFWPLLVIAAGVVARHRRRR